MSADRNRASQGLATFGAVAVTSSPQQVAPSNGARLDLVYTNNGSITFYVGASSGVTVLNGYPMPAQAERDDDIGQDALWVVATASGGDLRWWETRLGR